MLRDFSACVIAGLIESTSPENVTCYHFCRFDNQESLKPRTIIGSIARQLVNDLPEDSFSDFEHGSPIEDFLETALNNTRQYFIILDGLDECNEAHIREVSENLYSLLSSSRLDVKLFWCSRPNIPDWIPSKLQSELHINLENVQSQSHVASDIEKFIKITLEGLLEGDTPRLRIGDPTLALMIEDRLKKEAHGMFLWVKLQLDSLCQKKSDKQIIDTLNHLPRDLPETFERILAIFTEPDDIAIGKQIFRWLAVAKRPLTVNELREAIAIEPLQDVWKPECLVNDMNTALACCGNLVLVEEEQQTIHFTHSSVQQYLCSDLAKKSRSRYQVNLDAADADAGAICVTYLNLPVFGKQIARTPKIDLNTTAITSAIVKSTLPAGIYTNKIALRLLRRQDRSSKSLQRLLEDTAGIDELTRQVAMLERFSFLSYAQAFWLEHTKQRISPYPGKLWSLWCNLLEDSRWRDTLAGYPWTFEDWEKGSTNLMEWIAVNNHCSLAQLLFDSGRVLTDGNLRMLVETAAERGHRELIEVGLISEKIPPTLWHSTLQSAAGGGHLAMVETLLETKTDVTATRFYDNMSALQAAAEWGHLAVVERLLQEKVNIDAASGSLGAVALQAAAKGGHLAVVERLLQAKADANACGLEGITALQAAVEGGYLAVVEKLLQAKANVNAAHHNNGRTALQAAAEKGHQAVVEKLLQANANVNALDRHGRTALQAAAEGGHLAAVEKLLQANAKVDIGPLYNGLTALQAAAKGGHLAVVEKLLQANAYVNNGPLYNGLTALQAAAEGGHLAVVERLLQEKADVNAAAEYGRTALQAAAGGGYLAVVERLLQEKAYVNAAPAKGDGRTALQAAAEGGHLAVVERLLQAEADVNAAPAQLGGKTALQAAAEGGHQAVVERLLQAKADVNTRDINGRTALQAAAEGGHLAVVERLLQAEADVDAAPAQLGGNTGLQAAAEGGHLAVVERLLQAKAKVNTPDNYGRTALQVAAGRGHQAVVEKLRAAGAK
ncbi:MAG: hypothetical protein Q9196_006931 [Gyalolechia fulgens]